MSADPKTRHLLLFDNVAAKVLAENLGNGNAAVGVLVLLNQCRQDTGGCKAGAVECVQVLDVAVGAAYAAYSPTMRVDAAEYRAMEYQIINGRTYSPADFKTNPSTTIDNIQIYGSSLDFGGNTYTVSKGSITLGTHQIPVKGLVLSSVPNSSGGYDNKIGDTVISTTAAPSAITFNGKWSASISTIGQEQYEYTKTEWIAGGFAWNGMDQSFLMVGLITSLGVFIALGIYARRSRASVWPLMLVCGGAAALFFIML